MCVINTRILERRFGNIPELRLTRINEALGFQSGTEDEPIQTTISILNDSVLVTVGKPGKEATRENKPNPNDMFPAIWKNNQNIVNGWAFEKLWEYLIKISICNQERFKKVLTLLYRNCFFIDHVNNNGIIRYEPSNDVMDYINNLQFALADDFKSKFKTEEISLLEFLHFVDVLAWNEDVKYNVSNGVAQLRSPASKTGRINTILSIISAPLLISDFINDIIEKTEKKGIIDVKIITDTIQKFTKTRGLCVLKNDELIEHLSPYLFRE